MLTIELRGETICRMSHQQLPGNKAANLSGHELPGMLLPVAPPLVNPLAFTALIRAFQCYPPWLLSQSLLLAPQSHCSPLYLSHLISSRPPSSPNSYSSVSHSPHLARPVVISASPSPPSALLSSDRHGGWCANTIPHISNEHLVIILSPQRLSVWLHLSLDAVTNGTASFSTAAIPQRWETEMRRCSVNTAQRDRRLMPHSDLHIYKGPFKRHFSLAHDLCRTACKDNLHVLNLLALVYFIPLIFRITARVCLKRLRDLSVRQTVCATCVRFEKAVTTDWTQNNALTSYRHLSFDLVPQQSRSQVKLHEGFNNNLCQSLSASFQPTKIVSTGSCKATTKTLWISMPVCYVIWLES